MADAIEVLNDLFSQAKANIEKMCAGIPNFLNHMKDAKMPGRYFYSFSGDLKNSGWGLGNTVFAAKIRTMIGESDSTETSSMVSYIQSFQRKDGSFSDPWIMRRSRFKRFVRAVKQRSMNNLFSEQTIRAESRQAFAALKCLNAKPIFPYRRVPDDRKGIRDYFDALDWNNPWAAASHASHLAFFLADKLDLIGEVFKEIAKRQQPDGSWYQKKAKLPAFQKVNAAMKIMTAYEATSRDDFDSSDKLIDLCLQAINEGHACNHLNVVYVLFHCSKKTEYRRDEIAKYFLRRLNLYLEHYWPEFGGFSFVKGRASQEYYWAKVSRGLPEPDIHATHLFLWGIVMMADFFRIREELGLQFPST